MRIWTEALPYFSWHELAGPGAGPDDLILDIRFAIQLPMLRHAWGRPLSPTSVCRTPVHNEAVDGHPRSLHLTVNPVHPVDGTMAADFWWKEWHEGDQLAFAELALALGWSVGLNTDFVHIDLRNNFGMQKLVFRYKNWDNRFTVTP